MKPSSKMEDRNPSGRGPMAPASTLTLNLYYRLPWLALCVFLFWQSSFVFQDGPPLFPYDDKVMHMGAYGFLALLIIRNLKQEKPFFSPAALRMLTILFASLYGLSDEVHQAFVPGRTASVWDFGADVVGSILGACFYLDFFHPRKPGTPE